MGTAGTMGIGGTVTAGSGGKAAAAGTAGTAGTAAGVAAEVESARKRAAWQVLLPASMSAMTSAVAKRAEAADAMCDLDS